MKKVLLILLLIIFTLLFPKNSFAHGGVEKRAGNILVTLFQIPLSPLVGEKVDFAFILTDPSKNHILKNKSAQIVITQTTTGDPSKDKIMYTKKVTSDVNGTIIFSYIFPKTNYYDIDLAFGKLTDEASTTGFLVQPRGNLQPFLQVVGFLAIISVLLNILFAIRFKMTKSKHRP
jgi:hypothetical protein